MNVRMPRRSVCIALVAGLSWGGCSGPSAATVHEGSLGAVRSERALFVPDGGGLKAAGVLRNGDPRGAALPRLGDTPAAVWHLEFKDVASREAFEADGVFVFHTFDRWADVIAPREPAAQQAIGKAAGLLWMDWGGLATAPPPPPAEPVASRGSPEAIVRGGLNRLTGKGVIVAVVDSGIDFRHPDFIALDAEGKPVSRILWFWDTTSGDHDARGVGDAAPIVLPNGSSLGTVYSRKTLTEDLRAAAPRIGVTDADGHGTACAGIAAGNGRAYADRRYAGVAPEADLIAVRIGGKAGGNLENAYLLGAICTWIDDVAGEQPCVVSCSFGGQYGGRDGARVLERQLDAHFADDVQGRILCIAAGNEAKGRLHAEAELGAAPGRLEWEVPDGGGAEVYVCFSTPDLNAVRWTSTGRTPLAQNHLSSGVHGLTKQGWATFTTGPGSFAVDLTYSGGSATVDAYISSTGGKSRPAFSGATAREGKQVATPATCAQAVTVGSYDFNDQLEIGGKLITYGNPAKGIAPLTIGGISRYSNPGPRRMGDLVKPELVAPGQFHTACRSAAAPVQNKLLETSGNYTHFNGTSAATPYCAGLFALMFQKNPGLSVGEIRGLLRTKMSRDARTGATPNPLWGYGKLDLAAARALLAAVKSP